MSELLALQGINWFQVAIGVIAALLFSKFIISTFEWFANKYGIETKAMRQKREDHDLLIATVENVKRLQERTEYDENRIESFLEKFIAETRHDSEELHESMHEQYENNLKYRDVSKNIREELVSSIKELKEGQVTRDQKIEKLTKMVLDKEIDDTRWKLLDFASALSSGRKYNQEAFGHVFRMYEKYEQILEENDMENGLVAESMKFVNEAYREHLKNGDFK